MTFDPRTIATPIYDALNTLRNLPNQDDTRLKQQKSQAVELYTYLSTWGIMRLKAEEMALPDGMMGKKQVVQKFFECLQTISGRQNLSGQQGLETLKNVSTDDYLGLTGLGLALAQEFSFWATAIYADVKGE
ncbi:hypothetical protein [Cylindrospermopsis raciborskii]|uniref:Uncharacterized protein n=1 Tax=Cylindrospermopsis raciborskii CENA302 TaxID=1170768 RepID=A0A9Q5WAB4_9CYAN|nr:hypothetical protein [Cylindrospermopsis raciborskii]EFA74173.1 hypothetical protein CRD_00858 [Raphidiopsis brookii D9]NLQ05362.1 hypothetical protein [Cylindrospermopsis raciborskii MVCC19]OHY32815.1 hypothetical protein BCV64_11635 [Cylindrospermopsis raciborskii MVCC14]OPH10482.1 hypothetical protein CENA302_05075 [Cylindrospermopsis raciborskii CENA302]